MNIISHADEHKEKVEQLASESWGGVHIVIHRDVYDLRELPCLVAISDEQEILGYCYYRIYNNECEIVALESVKSGLGVGTSLIVAVRNIAVDANCKRLYLQSTNDNTHAFRFYQRQGFTMCAVRWNELEHSRKIKPTIPLIGNDNIPLLHEIEFEILL